MQWLKRIGVGLLILYLLICAAVFVVQRKLLFFPPQNYLSPTDVGVPNMMELNLSSGTTSWWISPASDDKKVIIFFHGNGSAVFSNYHIFKDLIAQGHGVLSVGYPGYPNNAQTPSLNPSQVGIIDAAKINYQFVLDNNIAPDRIVFFGTSLGSGVASQLTAIHQPSLLILDAPFNSIVDMGRRRIPFLPINLLMKDKFESDKALSGLDVPLIWTHGTNDQVVPMSQGQKLFDEYEGPKIAHIIEGGHHTNLWGLGVREIVLARLDQINP